MQIYFKISNQSSNSSIDTKKRIIEDAILQEEGKRICLKNQNLFYHLYLKPYCCIPSKLLILF